MLAALLTSLPTITATATTSQAAQRDYAFGDVTENGGATTAQAAQSPGGTGNLTFHGGASSSQSAQETDASSELLIVGSADTEQRRQQARGRGLGPPLPASRPMRGVRGNASTTRPVALTIRSGA